MNKRLEKKRVKIKICKSPVYQGAKIKSKQIRLMTYYGKFTTYGHGLAVNKRPKLKSCPICGRVRKAGYFKSCRECAWILEYRQSLDGVFENIEMKLREMGAGLRRTYYGSNVDICVTIRCACQLTEATDGKQQDKIMDFSSQQRFSLYELRHASYSMTRFLENILNLYKCAKETAEASVDENGNAMTLHSIILPTLGKWRM